MRNKVGKQKAATIASALWCPKVPEQQAFELKGNKII